MHATQKRAIEQRFGAKDWYGRGPRGRRTARDFGFEGSELMGWTLVRVERETAEAAIAIHTMWQHDEAGDELLAIDVFECATVKAAHDRLIETLGEMQSPVVARLTGRKAIGDVSFGLNDTMVLFARANVVVWIRNAGPSVVKVGGIARVLDQLLERRTEPDRKR